MKVQFVLLSLLLTIVSCAPAANPLVSIGTQSPATPVEPSPQPADPILLQKPFQLKTVELAPQAIPTWRDSRVRRPTLLLLSANPMLAPIPEALWSEVTTLVEKADEAAFRAKAKSQVADPLLMPGQSVSAALQSGFFSELVWIIPLQDETQEMSLEIFREQLVAAGVATPDEAAALTQMDGVVSGNIRGLPFRSTTLRTLPKLGGPVVLHLDLSYFANRYENEVTTPIYSLVHGTLSALRLAGISITASTLAVSTEEDDVPLEMRFLRDVLATVFANPTILDEPLPEAWDLRKEARYFDSFFQPQAVLERYLRLCELVPEDASAEFDTYRALISLKDTEEAEKHLDLAVWKDAGYAREYVNLALASSKPAAVKLLLLQKAIDNFPANPFLRMEKLNLMLALGQHQPAKKLLESLSLEHWSQAYYPEIPAMLEETRKTLDLSAHEQ